MGYTVGVQPPTVDEPPRRSTALGVIGLVLATIGVATAIAFYVASSAAERDAVSDFARAKVGCVTTLQFDRTGRFTLYVETKGGMGILPGDCRPLGTGYARTDDDLPRLAITLTGPDGTSIDQSDAAPLSYDVGRYRGEALRTVRIDVTGTYRLTVTGDATDVAVAVGGRADATRDSMRTWGLALGALGLVLGGALAIAGFSRRSPTRTPVAGGAPGWQGVPGAAVHTTPMWQPGPMAPPPAPPSAAPAPLPPPPLPPPPPPR